MKATVDHALAIERELWSGEPTTGAERRPPAEIAAKVEDLTRAILGDAACGHLGTELRTTADEILLGEGLQVGEGAPDTRGETAEWNPSLPIDEAEDFGIETLDEELEAAVAPPVDAISEPEEDPCARTRIHPRPEPDPRDGAGRGRLRMAGAIVQGGAGA